MEHQDWIEDKLNTGENTDYCLAKGGIANSGRKKKREFRIRANGKIGTLGGNDGTNPNFWSEDGKKTEFLIETTRKIVLGVIYYRIDRKHRDFQSTLQARRYLAWNNTQGVTRVTVVTERPPKNRETQMNIAMDYSRLKLEFAAVRSTNSLLHDVESKIVAACV